MAEEKKAYQDLTAKELSALEKVDERIIRMMFIMEGFCPNCHQRIRDWKEVLHVEVRSTVQNNGINPKTGHRLNCAG